MPSVSLQCSRGRSASPAAFARGSVRTSRRGAPGANVSPGTPPVTVPAGTVPGATTAGASALLTVTPVVATATCPALSVTTLQTS